MSASSYRAGSFALYGLYFYIGLPLVIALSVLGGSMVSSGWGIVLGIVIFLVAAGLLIQGFEHLRRWRSTGFYQRCFPGHAGERFPIFHLLEFAGADGDRRFDKPDVIYSLGEATDSFFVLRNGKSETPHRLIGGTPILTLPKDEIVSVEVIERSDDEIAAGAVDPRDWSERAGAMIAGRITGARMKTRIVPFAAYLVMTLDGAAGERRLVAAVPTDVPDEALAALGEEIVARTPEANWLIEAGIDKAKDTAKDATFDALDKHAGPLLGTTTMDIVHQGQAWAHEGLGWVKEVNSWADPDKASIGSTKGAKGRTMAHLIADRIRGPIGLPIRRWVAPADQS